MGRGTSPVSKRYVESGAECRSTDCCDCNERYIEIYSGEKQNLIYYNSGNLKALIVFLSIFKGKHMIHKEMVEILTGFEITVKFDCLTARQINGDILNATSYKATLPVRIPKTNKESAFIAS